MRLFCMVSRCFLSSSFVYPIPCSFLPVCRCPPLFRGEKEIMTYLSRILVFVVVSVALTLALSQLFPLDGRSPLQSAVRIPRTQLARNLGPCSSFICPNT